MPDSSLTLFLSGLSIGLALYWLRVRLQLGGVEKLSQALIEKAEKECDIERSKMEMHLKEKEAAHQKETERLWHQERKKLRDEEERLSSKEDKLETRVAHFDKKLADLEKRESQLLHKIEQLDHLKKEVNEKSTSLSVELEKVGALTQQEAKEAILKKVEHEVRHDAAKMTQRILKEAEQGAEKKVQTLLATVINRMAASAVSENTITTVTIPNEELKGRIIGREGRNIRALERATGVNFIIDDTPGAVVLSCFDPVRRHIAKVVLTELLSDGRIHPTRIEEMVAKTTERVQKEIREKGENGALRLGVMGLHPELLYLLGKLAFRTSYGQNILEHSIEVGRIMGLMAGELGLNVKLAQRIGLLHDMGKALTQEMQGTHAVIGHDLALKYGESAEVANGIGCHHQEMPALTVEGSLTSSADALSASRPGARIEAVEEYIKRIKKLEEIAYEFPGIEKSYALQAGREIRVIVLPEMIDDHGMVVLARDLTKRIESTLDYPGKIKITVIREKRAIDYAI